MYSIKELKLKVAHKVVCAGLWLDSIPCRFPSLHMTPGLPKWLEIEPTLLKIHLKMLAVVIHASYKKWITRLVLLKWPNPPPPTFFTKMNLCTCLKCITAIFSF